MANIYWRKRVRGDGAGVAGREREVRGVEGMERFQKESFLTVRCYRGE